MVAKCSNPACDREFRELSKGRLFLLPPVYDFTQSIGRKDKLIDCCYWLCPECAQQYTLILDNNRPVIRKAPQAAKPSAARAVAA
jgi:hypothetical protein